tara:strand:+ start:556 stop:783 length:228 start_codon:yes stop_codon:yes gene_type:complete
MAKHAKANVASNALRECLLEEKELIIYIYVSFFLVKKFTRTIRDQQKSLFSSLLCPRLGFCYFNFHPKKHKKKQK